MNQSLNKEVNFISALTVKAPQGFLGRDMQIQIKDRVGALVMLFVCALVDLEGTRWSLLDETLASPSPPCLRLRHGKAPRATARTSPMERSACILCGCRPEAVESPVRQGSVPRGVLHDSCPRVAGRAVEHAEHGPRPCPWECVPRAVMLPTEGLYFSHASVPRGPHE